MVGKTVSHYKILEKLGEGGMGEVYLAEDTELDRKIALKFLPPQYDEDAEIKTRFKREAKAAAALNHPNIITIYEVGEFEGKTYIAMEYVEGESLKECLSRQELSLEKSIEIAIEVCKGLSEAHQAGIVHRDIKPDNILINSKEQVKIADFGLAKVKGVSRLTKAESTLGTVSYMSPEQTRGEDVDQRSDIFSFGAVLYEMITARLPFEGDYEAAITYSILHEEPEPVERFKANVPNGLQTIIDKTLAKTPDERYQHTDEIIVDLKSLKTELKSGKSVASSLKSKSGRRNQIYLYGSLATFLVLLLLIVGKTYFFPKQTYTIDSIAVLPLENLIGDPKEDYFVNGMTAELISKLCRLENLQVTSLRGAQQDIRQVGAEFRVRYVLSGSVRKAGERVRVTVKLTDASTGFHLWSDDFDGELNDLFALQEETALKIAEALNFQLTPEETEAFRRRYTENSKAYDAFLRGWALIESFHVSLSVPEERLEAAQKHFEEALASDPNYALALAGLSIIHSYSYYFKIDATPECLQRAEDLARRALALDPQLSEAHVALAEPYSMKGDFANAIAEFRQGLRHDRSDPRDAFAWCHLAFAYNAQTPSDPKAAEEAARAAIRLHNPVTSGHTLSSAWRSSSRPAMRKPSPHMNTPCNRTPTSIQL